MSLPFVRIDAFTTDAFAGNPAAVCVLPDDQDAEWMQLVAREMNAGATAFLRKRVDGYDLRWFAPAAELELCGHGTLASAHALWEGGHLMTSSPARFYTRAGLLTAVRRGDWIELDFPAAHAQAVDPPVDLAVALGAPPRYVGQSRLDHLIELDREDTVRHLRPDLARLASIPGRGFIVTSRAASPNADFVSRFFAPSVGIDEDPVTGSAHCTLGPFWSARLGKDDLVGRQLSDRGGVVKVSVAGDRVRLSGQAVTVLRGELLA
ncbi:MAG: PhzF family phenazine biosynthesis protein [Acidobacteriia bacterium]|nr:PhzF family phenazine biosynthesis protein [Terriglobia bacterium]